MNQAPDSSPERSETGGFDPGSVFPEDGDQPGTPTGSALPAKTDQTSWKAALRERFEAWLGEVEATQGEIAEGASTSSDMVSPPDLYSFFKEMTASRTENRRVNRRITEVFSNWGEKLDGFGSTLSQMEEDLATVNDAIAAEEQPVSRSFALVLIEMADRLRRVGNAFEQPPARPKWRRLVEGIQDGPWRSAWQKQKEAFSILLEHYEGLLEKAGVSRIAVEGAEFDPQLMTAIDTETTSEHPERSVTREVRPGYRFQGELLRTAQVIVARAETQSQ